MTKQQYIDELVKDARFDSQWINESSQLLETYADTLDYMTPEWLSQYDYQQVVAIGDILAYNAKSSDLQIDIDVFANPALNATQMQVLFQAISQSKNPVSVHDMLKDIARPEISYERMNYIAAALLKDVDIRNLADTYTGAQLFEIEACIETGIDYSIILDSTLSAEAMGLIRHAAQLGFKFGVNKDKMLVVELKKDKK